MTPDEFGELLRRELGSSAPPRRPAPARREVPPDVQRDLDDLLSRLEKGLKRPGTDPEQPDER